MCEEWGSVLILAIITDWALLILSFLWLTWGKIWWSSGAWGALKKPGVGPWLVLVVFTKLRLCRTDCLLAKDTHSPFPVRNASSASLDFHSAFHIQLTAMLALLCAQFS